MKTIGMLGGMSWESTITYYQIINQFIKEKLGGLHSAKILLHSVDFAEIEKCQAQGDWDKSGDILAKAASGLEQAGADFIIICTNTMHKVAGAIQSKINIPVVHIAEATAEVLKHGKIETVGLLGTKYTMTQDFYKAKLVEAGIRVLIPDSHSIEMINRIIYDELCLGICTEQSKQKYVAVIERLAEEGAQGVILGCTEIGLLIDQKDTLLPVFDTTRIHAEKAALLAVGRSYFLETERIGFSKWSDTDLELAAQLWGEKEVTRFICASGEFTQQDIWNRLAVEIDNDKRFSVQYWPIFEKITGELIGCCGIRPFGTQARSYELGFHLRPKFWGRGYGFEAAETAINYSFKNRNAIKLYAGHHPENAASERLLKKLGFQYIGKNLYAPTGLYHPSYELNSEY